MNKYCKILKQQETSIITLAAWQIL